MSVSSENEPGRRPIQTRNNAAVKKFASALASKRVTPNQISVIGIGFALVGAVALATACRGWLWPVPALVIAALCVQARLMCNLLDGLVAVEGGLKGKAGDLFNEFPDRIEDTLFLAAAGHACGEAALGWACAALAAITAYVRALGASLGQGQDFSGPCAKQHRMAILTAAMLGAALCELLNINIPVLPVALWIIVAGTFITIARRVLNLYRRLP